MSFDVNFSAEDPVEIRVFLHKKTANLVCARPVGIITLTTPRANGICVYAGDARDWLGWTVFTDDGGMLMGKDFVADQFEDLGEL